MRFLNLTRQLEIGANSYFLEIGGKKVVLDCGMHPRYEGFDALPDLTALPDESVDAILLSHAHQDHIGSIPVLMRRHPGAQLFATDATLQIGEVMLHNSVNVMLRIREERGIASYPLFTHREIDLAARRWHPVPLHQRWSFEGERLGALEEAPLSFEFYDAGHIIGSAGVMIRGEGRTIFYTGDVNFDDQTISSGARFPEEPLDVLIVETTRGDHQIAEGFTREAEELRLGHAIREVFEEGGAVLIPVFALGKTQELLAMLAGMQQRGVLPFGCPVYIGGLSAKLTEIYDKLAGQWPRLKPNLRLLDTVAPFVVNGRGISELPIKSGHVYALTSGMMTENTLSNLFGGRFLDQAGQAILFIGYADPNSPGGRLRSAARGDSIQLDGETPPKQVECGVEVFDFSAHASRESIRAWVNKVTPKKIVLVHGDQAAVEWFRSTLSADLPGSEIILPAPGELIEL
ncbi:MAG: MBL fold metallo-hydrolase [Verrucomicrobiota bacterium]